MPKIKFSDSLWGGETIKALFLEVARINGEVVLSTVMFDDQVVSFSIGDMGNLIMKMDLMKFLFCVHELIHLLK